MQPHRSAALLLACVLAVQGGTASAAGPDPAVERWSAAPPAPDAGPLRTLAIVDPRLGTQLIDIPRQWARLGQHITLSGETLVSLFDPGTNWKRIALFVVAPRANGATLAQAPGAVASGNALKLTGPWRETAPVVTPLGERGAYAELHAPDPTRAFAAYVVSGVIRRDDLELVFVMDMRSEDTAARDALLAAVQGLRAAPIGPPGSDAP